VKKRVLVVEDDIDINKALSLRLNAAGYEVYTAQDGLVGLCTAVRERPDLLILDVTMPGGDGLSVVERLKNNPDVPDIPFIILTASKRPDYREAATALGASAFLEKPYEARDLLAAVARALEPLAVA
jgi:DNA-binding response OmpR family regulator